MELPKFFFIEERCLNKFYQQRDMPVQRLTKQGHRAKHPASATKRSFPAHPQRKFLASLSIMLHTSASPLLQGASPCASRHSMGTPTNGTGLRRGSCPKIVPDGAASRGICAQPAHDTPVFPAFRTRRKGGACHGRRFAAQPRKSERQAAPKDACPQRGKRVKLCPARGRQQQERHCAQPFRQYFFEGETFFPVFGGRPT